MKRFIPNFFLQTIKKIIASETSKSKMNFSNNMKQISIKDFKLSNKNLDSCLDLYEVCRK